MLRVRPYSCCIVLEYTTKFSTAALHVLKVLRYFFGYASLHMYADSSRGFYSPWMRDTVIDSPITAVCSGIPTKNYFSELNAAFYF